MTFVGMDPAAMRSVATSLRARGRELEDMVQTIDTLVDQCVALWPGDASLGFQDTWHGARRDGLQRAASDVVAAGRGLMRHVDEQVEASSGGGASSAAADGALQQAQRLDGRAALRSATMLELAGGAYPKTDDARIEPWREVTDAELIKLGIDPLTLHDERSGFDAKVYVHGGRYVVGFAGTEELLDGATDVAGTAALTRQSELAVGVALTLKGAVGENRLAFSGHSLGGRLAALSSIATGAPATTFNAAGVSPADMMFAHVAGGGSTSVVGWGLAAVPSLVWPLPSPPALALAGASSFVHERFDAGLIGADTSHITNFHGTLDPISGGQALSPAPDAVGRQVDTGWSGDVIQHGWHGLRGRVSG